MNFEENILTQRLPNVFGGRDVQLRPNLKTGRPIPQALPVTSPYLWWDLSDLSTVTRTNGLISAVTDKSGNARNATVNGGLLVHTPATPAYRLPGVLQASGGHYLSQSATILDDFTSSWFGVAMVFTTGVTQALVGPSDVGSLVIFIDSSQHLNTGKHGAAGQAITTASVTSGVPFVFGCLIDGATSIRQYINMTGETDSTSLSVTGSHTMSLGLAAFVTQVHSWFGEVIAYNTVLSQSQGEDVVGYLMSKWGIS